MLHQEMFHNFCSRAFNSPYIIIKPSQIKGPIIVTSVISCGELIKSNHLFIAISRHCNCVYWHQAFYIKPFTILFFSRKIFWNEKPIWRLERYGIPLYCRK